MKAFNQIRNAIELIKGYKGAEPLNLFLKSEFKKRPQFGSTDRRLMRELCSCYFKTGVALPKDQYELRILLGYFLNNTSSHPVFEFLAEELNHAEMIPLIDQGWDEKKTAVSEMIKIAEIFPFSNDIEAVVKESDFYKDFFQKPVTWLRVRIKAKERFEEFLNQSKNF